MNDMMELTVESIQRGYADGTFSCVELVRGYLDRIEKYDKQGPAINALITLNPRALEIAATMDAQYKADPAGVGSLHGIPVIIKDNYNTSDLPTTGGSAVLAKAHAREDAFIVQRLRAAGAVILAKANLTELARGGTTISSLGGQTRNPYDLTRTPGGSSGGSGAAMAANFGVLSTGSDTGQSIRSPASAASCVGVRATRGLISRAGIMPGSTTQDEGGPITRTVADAARMLDVIAGYDPADPITAFGRYKRPVSYSALLDAESPKGARIGLLTNYVGSQAVHEDVNIVLMETNRVMRSLGAVVVRVAIPGLDELTDNLALGQFEFKDAFNRYLCNLVPGTGVASLHDFLEDGRFYAPLEQGLRAADAVERGTESAEYKSRVLRREDLRQAIMTVMAANQLDALLYPHQQRLVSTIGEEQLERNGVLSNSSGFPAVTFAGGFSPPTERAPIGVPIGIELLGPEWSEPLLLSYAYAFEQAAQVRRSPLSTPAL